MRQIYFITENSYKFKIAQGLSKKSGLRLIQKKLETPEIQSESVEDVAAFSAQWAADFLRKPVITSDVGVFIETLNGFPGPFIKYVNAWLSAKDLLTLMRGRRNRKAAWKECLAYCEPRKKPKVFTCTLGNGTIAHREGKRVYRRNYGWMDTIFMPTGYSKTLSECPDKEYLDFWSHQLTNHDSWPRLARHLAKNS